MNGLIDAFKQNFIEQDRWKYLANGLKTTLLITLFAVMIGAVLGFVVAIIRSTYERTGKMKILNFICRVYLTVIRGTPMVVQLLITYFVIFSSVNISKLVVAILAFGINSGAYVAEIVRSGIMSIDNGQFEAGRSLGLSYRETMISIVLPQAFKTVLCARERVHSTAERNFGSGLHSHTGPHKGRRHYPLADLLGFHAADNCRGDLPAYGNAADPPCKQA